MNPHTYHVGKDIVELLDPSQLEHLSPQVLKLAADEIVRLREALKHAEEVLEVWKDDTRVILKERDEARQEVCARHGYWREEYAKTRGWDLFFAETKPELPPDAASEEPPYDKYDGVLPGDIGTDRP